MSKRKPRKAIKTYEIGYGRPPKAHQFKPGQSGNRHGRPRNPKTLTDHFERELRKTVIIREGDRTRKVTKGELLATRMVNDALNGDYRKGVLVHQLTERKADGVPADAAAKSLQDLGLEDQAILQACLGQIQGNDEGGDGAA